MRLVDDFSALVSWNSYDYQGYIALHVALAKILDCIKNKNDFSKLSLQIEGKEDFSLLDGNACLSLHQVKAGRVNLDKNDIFCFIIQIIQNKSYGYLHINTHEKVSSDFCKITINYIDGMIDELSQSVVEKNSNDEDKKKKICCNQINIMSAKGSKYQLIKTASADKGIDTYDVKTVEGLISDIKNELSNHKKIIENRLNYYKSLDPPEDGNLGFWKIYDERYDTISEIREKSAGLIKEILSICRPRYMFANEEYCLYVLNQLILMLKKRIQNSINKSGDEPCIISFSDLLNAVELNYKDEFNDLLYQYYQVVRGIEESVSKYPINYSCGFESCIDCDKNDECNLVKQIDEVLRLDKKKLGKFLFNLMLYKPEPGKNNNLPSDEQISYVMLDTLSEVNSMLLDKEKNLLVALKNNKTYRLSLDGCYNIDAFLTKLKEYTQKEPGRSTLYETDSIITERISGKQIKFDGGDFTELGMEEINDLSNEKIINMSIDEIAANINEPQIIQLIKKEDAIGVLK